MPSITITITMRQPASLHLVVGGGGRKKECTHTTSTAK